MSERLFFVLSEKISLIFLPVFSYISKALITLTSSFLWIFLAYSGSIWFSFLYKKNSFSLDLSFLRLSLNSWSLSGKSYKPEYNDLKYIIEPPTNIGSLFLLWVISIIFFEFLQKSETLKTSFRLTISTKWWGYFSRIFLLGFAEPTSQSLYTITESTLINSTGNLFANFIAKSVFPDAVGPKRKTIGLCDLSISEHPHLFHLF